jgi:hypothetical protein
MKQNAMRAALVVGLAIAACGSDAGAELLRDAGAAIADAGRWLADAGARGEGDAAAQQPGAGGLEVHEVACSALYEWTETRAGGAKTRQARLYAELDADTQGLSGVSFLRCGVVTAGYAYKCPADAQCTGALDPAVLDCDTGQGVQVGSDKLRALCGYGTAEGDAPIVWAYRWARGRFALHR